jgi:hypothetical protein
MARRKRTKRKTAIYKTQHNTSDARIPVPYAFMKYMSYI